jgi:hypothetical protein
VSLKVWAEWSACCALAFQLISAEAVAQTQDGATRTVESTMKKQRKQSKDAVVITLSGDRNMQDVVRDLKASGLEVPKKDQELGAIGVVTGLAPSTSIAKLRRVPGVKDVSPDHKVDIGPPGAPVTW